MFDYETARMDIADAGADPDYLSSFNPVKRDEFLRKVGLDPRKYGGGQKDEPKSKKNW